MRRTKSASTFALQCCEKLKPAGARYRRHARIPRRGRRREQRQHNRLLRDMHVDAFEVIGSKTRSVLNRPCPRALARVSRSTASIKARRTCASARIGLAILNPICFQLNDGTTARDIPFAVPSARASVRRPTHHWESEYKSSMRDDVPACPPTASRSIRMVCKPSDARFGCG